MNWGLRIIILYLGFVAIILTLVFTAINNKEELEAKDYYKQEIDYQNKIDAMNNANNLSTPINYQVDGKSIAITIPSELRTKDFKGEIYLFKPSDSSKDLYLKFTIDADGKSIIQEPKIGNGVYKMKITVISNAKKYVKEEVIKIS